LHHDALLFRIVVCTSQKVLTATDDDGVDGTATVAILTLDSDG
jgi:hypothetical protein